MPYSHREDFPIPVGAKPTFYQPFTIEEWNASNFAPPSRMEWFQDARYGMFIHFGLSTFVKQDLSWGVCHTRKAPDSGNGPVPDAEWQRWPAEFRLEKFDAQQWVQFVKQAGFRYLVLITKHHDGFHMWDTDESDFKITNTPFGRDVVKEVVDACHEAGMPVGLYYSQRDWYHPDYMPVDPAKVEMEGSRWSLKPGVTSPIGDCHAKYLAYQERAIRELCTRYGKLDIFWWDAAWWGNMFTAEMWDGEHITRLIRELQPGIIINNRCSLPGDFDTPEGKLGSFQNWRPWESCICLTGSWSYSDTPPKPLDQLIRMVVSNACGGGNLLLSWGPHWDGAFDDVEAQRLLELGRWLNTHEAAIFGTRAGPWKPNAWGGSVHRDDTIYLHITELEGETLDLPALPGVKVLSARLLDGDALVFTASDTGLGLTIPTARREASVTIVELKLDRKVTGTEAVSTGEHSIFNDSATYGGPIQEGMTVRTVSLDTSLTCGEPDALVTATRGEAFRLVTTAQTDPHIDIDLGSIREVTGIAIEQSPAKGSYRELTILVSRDGNEWEEAATTKGLRAELEINGYHSGAYIPGRPARYLRIKTHADQHSAMVLRSCSIYAKPIRA